MQARILVVDDDGMIRGLLKDFFESLGHKVLCLERAREALLKIGAEYFDIVITDCAMPEMDGLEFTRILRGNMPSMTIIGISDSEYERSFLDVGADLFVPKPLELRRLREVVESCLRSAR